MLHSLSSICRFIFFFLYLFFCLEHSVLPQTGVGVGSSHPGDENSRMPVKVKLSGFINTLPGESSIATIKLGIGIYHETYQFDVVNLEAADRDRVSAQKLLQPADTREVAWDLTGSKELLSKIAQSEPGTPLAITGFLQPRERKIQLTEVEIIGLGK